MKREIKDFESHRRERKRRKKKTDSSVERTNRLAQDAMRDWQTDAYRSQSGRREADVVPIN